MATETIGSASEVGIGAGSSVSIGGRPYQEDRCVIISNLNYFTSIADSVRRSFFAIFDGHGGDLCSTYLANNFYLVLGRNPKLQRDPQQALRETWKQMDVDFYASAEGRSRQASARGEFPRDGSTATVALLVGNTVYVTNCGDSAAVIVYTDGALETLTEEHGTGNAAEVQRCLAAGGSFYSQRGARVNMSIAAVAASPPNSGTDSGNSTAGGGVVAAKNSGRFDWLCCRAVGALSGPAVEPPKPRLSPGGLLVTRAFGDFHAKKAELGLGGMENVLICDHGVIQRRELVPLGTSPAVTEIAPAAVVSTPASAEAHAGTGASGDAAAINEDAERAATANAAVALAPPVVITDALECTPETSSSHPACNSATNAAPSSNTAAAAAIRYIVLASDGVWDAVSKENVVEILKKQVADGSSRSGAGGSGRSGAGGSSRSAAGGSARSAGDGSGRQVTPAPSPASRAMKATKEYVIQDPKGAPSVLDSVISEHCSALSRSLVSAAVTSEYWRRCECSPDNTSCVIIEVAEM